MAVLFLVQACGSALLAYAVGLVVYRLFFSPLSSIPGPKLAAATYAFEYYYDIVGKGRYTWKIHELHQQYGPIVRINPDEVHFNDSTFYDEIYAREPKKRNKIRFGANNGNTLFEILDHDVHRRRRAAMNPSFSKRTVQNSEQLVRESIDELMERLDGLIGKEPVSLHYVFTGLNLDVISGYCYGKKIGCLKNKNFGKDFFEFFHSTPQLHPLAHMIPWLFDILFMLPPSIPSMFMPEMKLYQNFLESVRTEVMRILPSTSTEKTEATKTTNVIQALVHSNLKSEEITPERLVEEASFLLAAGGESTTSALALGAYYVLKSPQILARLREELRTVLSPNGDVPPVPELERLPYLTGVVQESVRLSFGVPGRLPRIAPYEGLKYGKYIIPSGTVVSQSLYLLHTDPAVFPKPLEFEPERWATKIPSQKFSPFSRGARMCIGMNLAYAELYLAFAHVFSRFNFELHDTVEEDVIIKHDFFVGMADVDSKGIWAKVTGKAI
ncbi:Cytochrome P450 monooxygenase sdnE [Cladobotryum mycophilum]|uniref:Cytochrome P450 monooxygenase sdnE n=1 Tax=Cladobotryum mycophilum TaxID=491253 RepID=A0ABR0SGY2_9HYPO